MLLSFPPCQFTVQPHQLMMPIVEPFVLWHYNYSCFNFFHFFIEGMPALIVALRALNGSQPVVTVMAEERQVSTIGWYLKAP